MTYQDFLNEIAENDKKIAAEHFTEEQEEAAYADFIIKNKLLCLLSTYFDMTKTVIFKALNNTTH